ncbi:glycosyltransferase family 9 protein [Caulobacter segnis]|uniref:Glycosyl transferase family 9 n=2 Tax=Caulobacter segnis TaxID=88688 RepID=D5VE60_CAUST|nr:glycosyltransferase family 9 protein [Caulobacter segnis]ADG08883.1 glycosyl transferase family 9 [Caulobacter segnis ATCC 21756]AVQ00724.1 glycosyltransferase family 9 protein [Caulobacter segnis]
MTQRAFPILFITATRIGDAVLSSGLIKLLSDQIPNARFTIVAGPLAAPLFAHVPGLDRVIVMEKGKGKGHWFKLWNQVRHKKWGLVVDLRGSATALFLRRDKRAIWKKTPGEPVHKVVDAARVLKLEGEPPAPYLYITPEVEALADELLGRNGGQGGGPILAVGPAANWIGKVWPIERFAQTAAKLLDKDGPLAGGRLLILGGPEDTRMVEELRMASARGRTIDLTGKVDLLTAYACLKRASLFIGNDSGLMHIAAAAGCPTVGLFGPSDERRYGPWGDKTVAVRGPRTFQQFLAVDPDLSQAIRHMSDLPVTTVVRAAKELLTRVATPAEVSPPEPLVEAVVETAEPETSPWGEPIEDVAVDSPPAAPAVKTAKKRTVKRDAG